MHIYAYMRCAGYTPVMSTVYDGYTYYHIDADASICVYEWCTVTLYNMFGSCINNSSTR